MLTATLLLLAAPARPMQDDDLIKLTRALEMLGPVTPEWIMATHPGILTVLDAGKRIYRLEVLGQTGAECSLHSMRNCFYLLKLFTSPRADFDAIYNQMRSEESYKKFMEGLACPLGPDRINPNMVKEKIALGALPVGSQDMEKRISWLEYYNGKILLHLFGTRELSSEGQYKEAQELKAVLADLEPNLHDPELIAEAVVTDQSAIGYNAISLLYELAKTSNCSFCMSVAVATVYRHATALFVTKQDGVISFIYANTIGDRFIDNAMAAINIVVNFAHDPTRLENAVIRWIYKYTHLQKNSTNTLSNMQDNFTLIVQHFGTKALKNNTLFKTIYYPAFKKLFEDAKEKKVGKTEDAEEKKFLVSQVEKLLQDLDPSKG